MALIVYCLLCLVLFTFVTTTVGETGEDVNLLLTDIYTTRGYNKKIRPLKDQSFALGIAVDFYLKSVVDFDEKTESLKTSGFLLLSWTDEYIAWSPAAFNNTQTVFIPQDDIWKPDITLKNSFKSFSGLGSSFLNVQVENSGDVKWFPFQVLESTCSVSITYFPLDVQTCELKFSAWSYSKQEVTLLLGKKGIELEEYVPNASWEVVGTSAKQIKNSLEAAVIFEIKLKRKPRFYVINIVIPVIFLSVLNVFSFVLPVVSGERAGYSITVFLSLAVFLTIVSDQLPKNSEDTSLMAVYLMSVTGLSTVIVMICMVQLRIQSWHETNKPITQFYRSFVKVRNCFRCGKSNNLAVAPKDDKNQASNLTDVENDQAEVTQSKERENREEQSDITWLDVVNSMDFIFFTVSMLYTFICTLVIGVIAVSSVNDSVSETTD